MIDLVVLVADVQAKAVLEAVLARWQALGLSRPPTVEVVNTAGTDGGVRTRGVAVIAAVSRRARHALVVFDHHGCGEVGAAEIIEARLERELAVIWGTRAACLVLEPELEEWLVGASTGFAEVEELSGVDAFPWWAENGYPLDGRGKPIPVKRAMEALFDAHGARRSAANYRLIAGKASLKPERCRSRTFHKLSDRLRAWFG